MIEEDLRFRRPYKAPEGLDPVDAGQLEALHRYFFKPSEEGLAAIRSDVAKERIRRMAEEHRKAWHPSIARDVRSDLPWTLEDLRAFEAVDFGCGSDERPLVVAGIWEEEAYPESEADAAFEHARRARGYVRHVRKGRLPPR